MWLITAKDPPAVGWTSTDFERGALSTPANRFRLLSEDGEVCYEGRCAADPLRPNTLENEESGFEPLLHFGEGRVWLRSY